MRRSRRIEAGHTINEFHGDPASWMNFFAGPVQLKASGSFKAPVRQ
jgi:hypothetical protein